MMIVGTERHAPAGSNRVKLIAFAVFLAMCVAVAYLPGVRERATLSWVNSQLGSIAEFFNRPYGPAAFILVSAIFLLLHMPGLLMVIVGALVYGGAAAFFYSWIGSILGTTIMFLIARYLLRDYFRPKLERSFLKNFLGKLEANGIFFMSFLRVMVFMFPPLNWLMGAADIRVRDYVIGNMIGLAPIVFGVQLAVRGLSTIRSMSDLFTAQTLAVVLVFLAFLAAIALIRKRYLPSKS